MKNRWKMLLTLGGLAATAALYRTFEGDPETRRRKRERQEASRKKDTRKDRRKSRG